MKRAIYDTALNVRDGLLGGGARSATTARRAAQLDPAVRSALAATLRQDGGYSAVTAELAEIERQLERARTALRDAVGKKEFLSLRAKRYRAKLDEQARALHDERLRLSRISQEANGEGGGGGEEHSTSAAWEEFEQRMEKWEKDEDALEKVEATVIQMNVQCEDLKRKIDTLETRKKNVVDMSVDCETFLQVAAAGDETFQQQLSEMELTVMEEGRASSSSSSSSVQAKAEDGKPAAEKSELVVMEK
jgi:hypothetical protein